MKSKSPNKIWIIHGCALFLFVGLNGLFFILGGGSENTCDTYTIKESPVDPLPEIFTEEVADNRLDAYNRAIALIDQEQKEKELQDEQMNYLEDIMPTLYTIVGEVKKIINSNTEKISKVYITGAGALVNNVDLYFQEYF